MKTCWGIIVGNDDHARAAFDQPLWKSTDTIEYSNGRVFIQSWRWDPPKLSRKFPSFSQNDFGNFLSGGYPNRSSGIHRWGLDLSTGYPNTYFSWFSGYPQLTLVFLPGDEKFRIFSWGACHENQGLSTSSVEKPYCHILLCMHRSFPVELIHVIISGPLLWWGLPARAPWTPNNFGTLEVTQKWLESDFWAIFELFLSHFWVKNSHFRVTFGPLWDRPPGVTFESVQVSWNYLGFKGL